MRQTYEIVASDRLLQPGSSFSLLDIPVNQDLFQSFNNGQLPPHYPLGREDPRVLPLQNAVAELKGGNFSRWSSEQDLNCWFNFTDSAAMTRPNIVIFLDWSDPALDNTVLLLGDLGFIGRDMLLPCPRSWYATIPYGLEVWNASYKPPYFYYWTDWDEGGASVNTYLSWTFNGSCPSADEQIPLYQPSIDQIPNVTYCLTEVVEPSVCHLAYSTYLLRLITLFLFIRSSVLTVSIFTCDSKDPPLFLLGDALAEFLRHPDSATTNLSFTRKKKKIMPVEGSLRAAQNTRRSFLQWTRLYVSNSADEAERLWLLILSLSLIAISIISSKHLPINAYSLGTTVEAGDPS